MRIPMIFRLPSKLKPKQDELLFSTPDIYPTIFGLLGFESLIPDTVEGTNYVKTLMGESGDVKPTSQLYTFMPYGAQSYGRRGIRTDRYTLVIDRKIGKPLTYILHDNNADPYQLKNIADDSLELINELIEKELVPWLEHTGDPWRPTVVPVDILKAYV
ncbi:hypothetical protein D3C72_898460 [compost metagenome]